MITQLYNFMSHSRPRSGDAVHTVQCEAYAGVDHILAVAECSAHREHDLLIRTVERAECRRVGAAVIAYACRKGQLGIRIEVHRVQGCQSCRACQTFLHAAVYLADLVAYISNCCAGIFRQIPQLSHAGRIGIFFAVCHVSNPVAACVDLILRKGRTVRNGQAVAVKGRIPGFNFIGIYGIRGYRIVGYGRITHGDLVVRDVRTAYINRALLAVQGNVVADLDGLVDLDAVYIFNIFCQFDVQGITFSFHTDVSIAEVTCCAALQVQGIAQFNLVAGSAVARKGQAVIFHLVQSCFCLIAQVNSIVSNVIGFFGRCHFDCVRSFAYRCALCVDSVDALAFLPGPFIYRGDVGATLYYCLRSRGRLFQLGQVHSVRIFRTPCHVGDLPASGIYAVFRNGRSVYNSETVAADCGIANGNLIRGHAAIINSSIASLNFISGYRTVGNLRIAHGDLLVFDDGVANGDFVGRYAVSVNNGVACGNAVDLQVFGQLDLDLIIFCFGSDISTVPNNLESLVITTFQCISAFAFEFQFNAADGFFLGFFQLSYVHSIRIIFTICHVCNLLAAGADAVSRELSDGRFRRRS